MITDVYFDVFQDNLIEAETTRLFRRMAINTSNGYNRSITAGDPGYSGGSQPFTVEFWYQAFNPQQNLGRVFGSYNSTNLPQSNILIRTSTNGEINLTISGSSIITDSLVVPNIWNHFAFTHNGSGTYQLLINGVIRQTQTGILPATFTPRFAIGSLDGGTIVSQGFLWDEFRFWNRVLTDRQIKEFQKRRIITDYQISNDLKSDLIWLIRNKNWNGNIQTNLAGTGAPGNITFFGTATDADWLQVGFRNQKYLGRFNDWSVATIEKEINSGDGAANIEINGDLFKKPEIEEILRPENEINVNIVNNNHPNGLLVYRGNIKDTQETFISGRSEISLDVAGEVSNFTRQLAKGFGGSPFGGVFEIEINSSIRLMFIEFINRYRNLNDTKIYFTQDSIASGGAIENSRSIVIRTRDWLDAINTIYQMLPATYFWRIETDGRFVVREFNTEPDHIFTLGFDVIEINKTIRSTNIVNSYLGYNVNPGEPGAYTRLRNNLPSIQKFGLKNQVVKNPDLATQNSMESFLDRKLDLTANPTEMLTVKLSSSALGKRGFNIETVQPGDTFQINAFDDKLRIITKISYNFDTLTIFSEDTKEFTARRIVELQRQTNRNELSGSPINF